MRVMVLVKATEDSEQGILPTTEMFEAMGRFNDELRPPPPSAIGTLSDAQQRHCTGLGLSDDSRY